MTPDIDSLPAKSRNTAIVPEGQEAPKETAVKMDKGSPVAIASLGPPSFKDMAEKRQWQKEHMACAFRYLGREGYGKEGAAGHISLRDPVKPDHFWLNPLSKHFSQMTASDLVLVDHHGNIVDGEGGNNAPVNAAAFAIHSAIHAAQPDVIAACHAHSTYGKAWASLGIELPITSQDSCIFYKDQAVYDSFGGVVFQAEEGQRIAKALGDKRLLILQNHGLLTVGKTVDEAVFLFGAADRCCQAQLAADAAAAARGIKSIVIDEEDAAYTHSQIGRSDVHYIQFGPEYRYLLESTGGAFLK